MGTRIASDMWEKLLRPLFHVERAFWYFTNREIYCNILGICVGMFVTLPLAHMLLNRSQPIEVLSIRAEPTTAVSGDLLTLHWHVRVMRADCPGTVSRRFVDSTDRLVEFKPIEAQAIKNLPLGYNSFTTMIEVPRALAPGTVHYEPVIEFSCNWVQRYVWPIQGPSVAVPFVLVDNVLRSP